MDRKILELLYRTLWLLRDIRWRDPGDAFELGVITGEIETLLKEKEPTEADSVGD